MDGTSPLMQRAFPRFKGGSAADLQIDGRHNTREGGYLRACKKQASKKNVAQQRQGPLKGAESGAFLAAKLLYGTCHGTNYRWPRAQLPIDAGCDRDLRLAPFFCRCVVGLWRSSSPLLPYIVRCSEQSELKLMRVASVDVCFQSKERGEEKRETVKMDIKLFRPFD
jgi:hypothetical protein